MTETRSYWGWGYDGFLLPEEMVKKNLNMTKAILGIEAFENHVPKAAKELDLRQPRISLPSALAIFCSISNYDRASHSYGKSFRDVWRGLRGIYPNPPDYVAFPKTTEDIQELMTFASKEDITIIPFGGGSSVCGGVEPTDDESYKGIISVDMKHFNQILEIDQSSRSAHIQGGMFGPPIEAGLKPHGLTLRHFPQSFEFSTLGGWIATRSGGHFATLYTHIDEFVQNVSMITPAGEMVSRRLPGSGAGPSEERLICGSEGTLGIITSAWMRLQNIPTFKKTITVAFKDFYAGAEAARQIAQSGLNPANARLIDALEAFNNGLGDGSHAILIIGFESHQRDVTPWMKEALAICKQAGGNWDETRLTSTKRSDRGDAWKNSFLLAPYLRDELMKRGLVVETFETAVTWDQFPTFYKEVKRAANDAVKEHCGSGIVTCRLTHIYPDGAAPYFTIIAKGAKGTQLEQWDAIKKIVSNKLIEFGGTITHHHAVGRDHQSYYKNQRTDIFAKMLSSAKTAVDPKWILNPGILVDKKDMAPDGRNV